MATSIITRADDLGSSHSANIAISSAVLNGNYIKNVSCMAAAPYIEEGIEMVKHCKNVCFGLHAVINSEWDTIKWTPLSSPNEITTITTHDGNFYQDPSMFIDKKPSIEEILVEYNRQLDYLEKLGLNISYVDSHMFPEAYIPGLSEAMTKWIKEKGLIDHIEYYNLPASLEVTPYSELEDALAAYKKCFNALGDGQFFAVMHPAKYSDEMLLCVNKAVPEGVVAKMRNVEYEILLSKKLESMCDKFGIKCLRYDEAQKLGNTFEAVKIFFG